MTMTAERIRSFVLRYLEAEECDILEKHPAYVTVRLSPSADRDLTHRPYYWSFVERTGVTPETMTCTFIFDPETYRELHPAPQPGAPGTAQPAAPTAAPPGMLAASPAPGAAPIAPGPGAAAPGAAPPGSPGSPPQGDSILGRYFGFVPTAYTARVPRDELTYGSRRLEQIFDAVRSKGRFVRLFEQLPPEEAPARTSSTRPYETWFGVNYLVELACDLKRSEFHSLGIQLQTGEIIEGFQDRFGPRKMTPRLPPHVYVTPDRITLPRAVLFLEEQLEQKIAGYDHSWAQEAQLRLNDELERIRSYYEALLTEADPEKKTEIEAQYLNRTQEIEWQYRPRIRVSAINCGLFHVPAANRASY